ncbi:1-aminocyclopropane-1-carboxylate deaminase/D-cysteine desulfhydrase [candidate division CSSED10-310 bacterium]|uniref:1-aminocyclopropane-1-carboxylate deaminase/D-cysteine desulfhydrase n=1 Tax=candidate division CSSED10-310 bacterium TaxID=2855610 RepID=A0ABV6Z512_UNCC1
MIPLFEHYPTLAQKLPFVSLGQFPTPVEKLNRLGRELGLEQLYIKRDDKSGTPYGGNKVRKLEFLMGQALKSHVKEILTFGCAGSNHALATAVYAHRIGIRSISMLLPQPNALYVRHNLLFSYHCGAELHQQRTMISLIIATVHQLLRHCLKYGRFPQIIPPGGSNALGGIGFVNAAFELKAQIENGEIPEPDRIYVALGSMSTAVGLMLGLKVLNLKSRVIPVRIVNRKIAHRKNVHRLFKKSNALLHSLDPCFPLCRLTRHDVQINHHFFGQQYALFTEKGMQAVALMQKFADLKLEGTYTGKTFAALIQDARTQDLKNKVILFWNTYNSRDFSKIIAHLNYRKLPPGLHSYFTDPVQPLDQILTQ